MEEVKKVMLDINEALKLTDETAVVEQISVRRNLCMQMVGQLYPSILMGEIDRLEKLRWALKLAVKKKIGA